MRYSVGDDTGVKPFNPGSGKFMSTREIILLGSAAYNAPAGLEIEYVEVYFTTNGTRSLRKRIDASNWETDPWRSDV